MCTATFFMNHSVVVLLGGLGKKLHSVEIEAVIGRLDLCTVVSVLLN